MRAVGEDVLVHVQRGLAHRAECRQRIQHQLDADACQLPGGEQRCRAEFGDVRQHRHFHRAGEFGVLLQRGHRLGEDHVGSGFDAGLRACDGRLHAFHRERIGARHDHEARVAARIHRRLDAIHHLALADDGLVGAMPAALLHHLVFDVETGRTGLRDLARGARDVEGAAPAGVDVHQQRQVARGGDAARVLAYVMQGRDAEIGYAERRSGHAAAGKIQRLVPALLREDRAIGGDRADDLQGMMVFDGAAQFVAGGVFHAAASSLS